MKKLAAGTGIVLVVVLLAISPVAWHYFGNYNFRTVEEGAFYGSRQMSGSALERYIDRYHIRTVINMRGEHKGTPWYDDETAACSRKGVAHEDFSWSKNSIPDPDSLLRFLNLMETGAKPFLVHCEGGTHRTGGAAAAYLLMKGESTETARGQFLMGFNDAPIGDLVTLYEGSSLPFKEWVKTDYPALYQAWKEQKEREKAAEAS